MNELKDFKVMEISLVKEGAVMEDFLTLKKKNKEDELMPDKKLVEKLQEKKIDEKVVDKNIEVLKEKEAVLKKLEAENEIVLKEKADLELKLKAYQTKESEAVYKAKADKFDNLKDLKLDVVLKAVEENCSEEVNADFIKIIEKANSLSKTEEVFKELGNNNTDGIKDLEAIAKKKAKDENISFEIAYRDTLLAKPELYNETGGK